MAGQAAGSLPSPSPPRAPNSRPQGTIGSAGLAISRPTPAPQWPLAGPVAPPSDGEPYRPPPGRSEPPQRPPRPSRVPSILDSSKIQDQMTTVFAYNTFNQATPQEPPSQGLQPPPNFMNGSRVSEVSQAPQSSASSASRASTISSVGSIPDFPVPISAPVAIPVPPPVAAIPPPRRSVNLGPPPSARRGASSFYSNASYVAPIPEESPRNRAHTSYASSAAMPDNWGSGSSLALSPTYPDDPSFYGEIPEEGRESSGSGYGEYSRSGLGSPHGDETTLVRSASIGKRGKAALVTNMPFGNGTGYVDASSSSSGSNVPTNKSTARLSLTADNVLDAYDVATAVDPSKPGRQSSVSPLPQLAKNADFDFNTSSRQYSRLSAIRRPPRLDIDAVRKAEARGSLTSLPDLILRATRLAASLERGKRPASRIDDLNMSPSMYARELGMRSEGNTEKYQSGLSDMLAAFPPPGQPPNRRSMRRSFRDQVGSWPLPLNRNSRAGGRGNQDDGEYSGLTDAKNQRQRKGRRCCGLPLWGFIVTVIILLIVVAAAIIIPLEILVIRKQGKGSSLSQCQSQQMCANGGTSVISAQGTCSCICTNDFTGSNCTVAGDNGCTTTSVGSALSSVTLGTAIPRLLEQAQSNYSISLSATGILGAFNNGNLSCASENALVTFDGESMRLSSSGTTQVNAFNAASKEGEGDDAFVVSGVAVVTVTVEASASAAAKLKRQAAGTTLTIDSHITPLVIVPSSTTTVTTTFTPLTTATPLSSSGSTGSSGSSGSSGGGSSSTSAHATATLSSAEPTATFKVTEEILDFARVAVLYILQQGSLESAAGAQSALQRFFTNATTAANKNETVADVARNITLPNGNSVNLISLQVSAGTTLAGVGIS